MMKPCPPCFDSCIFKYVFFEGYDEGTLIVLRFISLLLQQSMCDQKKNSLKNIFLSMWKQWSWKQYGM